MKKGLKFIFVFICLYFFSSNNVYALFIAKDIDDAWKHITDKDNGYCGYKTNNIVVGIKSKGIGKGYDTYVYHKTSGLITDKEVFSSKSYEKGKCPIYAKVQVGYKDNSTVYGIKISDQSNTLDSIKTGDWKPATQGYVFNSGAMKVQLDASNDNGNSNSSSSNNSSTNTATFVGDLKSGILYDDVESCGTDFIEKGYVTNSTGNRQVIGCAYSKNFSSTPQVKCKSGYKATEMSGKYKDSNKEVKLYVCQEDKYSKARFIVEFKDDASYISVSNCSNVAGYIAKGNVSDNAGSLLIYGCAYEKTLSTTPTVRCPKDYSAVLYEGKDKDEKFKSIKVYLCQKGDNSDESNETSGSNPSTGTTPSTTTPSEEEDNSINGGGMDTGTVSMEDSNPRLDYNNLCTSEGFITASKIIGLIILIAKWLGPLILMIMGMIDFFKAVISSSDKALGDATTTFIKRMAIAIIIPIIPGLLNYLVNFLLGVISTETEERFALCTSCLNNPLGCSNDDENKDK